MHIYELFDTKIKYNITSSSNTELVAKTTINGRIVTSYFNRRNVPYSKNDEKNTSIKFKTLRYEPIWISGFFEQTPQEQRMFQKTGSGGEFASFAFFKQFLERAIEHFDSHIIKLDVSKLGSEDRGPLYLKLLLRYIPAGFELRRIEDSDTNSFWLIKNPA
jgi:hypothetical protein